MKKIRVLLALALVLTLCLSLCACGGSGSSSYKDAVKNYFNAAIGDIDAAKKVIPDFMLDSILKELDMDEDEYWEKLEDEMKDIAESAEDELGKNLKVSIKFEDNEKIDKDELEDVQDMLREAYDDEDIKVTAGYIVEGEATIKGKNDKETDDFELEVYKINGKWYVMG